MFLPDDRGLGWSTLQKKRAFGRIHRYIWKEMNKGDILTLARRVGEFERETRVMKGKMIISVRLKEPSLRGQGEHWYADSRCFSARHRGCHDHKKAAG